MTKTSHLARLLDTVSVEFLEVSVEVRRSIGNHPPKSKMLRSSAKTFPLTVFAVRNFFYVVVFALLVLVVSASLIFPTALAVEQNGALESESLAESSPLAALSRSILGPPPRASASPTAVGRPVPAFPPSEPLPAEESEDSPLSVAQPFLPAETPPTLDVPIDGGGVYTPEGELDWEGGGFLARESQPLEASASGTFAEASPPPLLTLPAIVEQAITYFLSEEPRGVSAVSASTSELFQERSADSLGAAGDDRLFEQPPSLHGAPSDAASEKPLSAEPFPEAPRAASPESAARAPAVAEEDSSSPPVAAREAGRLSLEEETPSEALKASGEELRGEAPNALAAVVDEDDDASTTTTLDLEELLLGSDPEVRRRRRPILNAALAAAEAAARVFLDSTSAQGLAGTSGGDPEEEARRQRLNERIQRVFQDLLDTAAAREAEQQQQPPPPPSAASLSSSPLLDLVEGAGNASPRPQGVTREQQGGLFVAAAESYNDDASLAPASAQQQIPTSPQSEGAPHRPSPGVFVPGLKTEAGGRAKGVGESAASSAAETGFLSFAEGQQQRVAPLDLRREALERAVSIRRRRPSTEEADGLWASRS